MFSSWFQLFMRAPRKVMEEVKVAQAPAKEDTEELEAPEAPEAQVAMVLAQALVLEEVMEVLE